MNAKRLTVVGMALLVCVAGSAVAGTLDDIKANVKANYQAISDLSATTSVTYVVSDPNRDLGNACDNYTGASLKWKPGGKSFLEGSGTDIRKTRCDGTSYYTVNFSSDGGVWQTGSKLGVDGDRGDHYVAMENHAGLIDGNTWSLAPGTFTVNGVSTYKIYCTLYEMYVDTTTLTKAIRITYPTGSTTEYLDYSSYQYVENTAYVPYALNHVYGNDSYSESRSNVSINDNLSDSVFVKP